MNDFENRQSAEAAAEAARQESEPEKTPIEDESKTITGEFSGTEATDSILRLLENSKLELMSLKDSALRTEKGAYIAIGEVSDSIIRIGELAEAVIGEINDAVVRIQAGSNVRVKRAGNCMFHVAEGSTLSIEDNIDSIVRGLGEYVQGDNAASKKSEADETAQKLTEVRSKLGQL